MASTFSDLGIELMSTGENAGTWGDKTNTNLQIVEKAIAGYVEKSIAGGAQTTALSITDGTTTESDSIARHAVIKLTGSITGNQIVTVPDSIEKVYIITNGTSGAYTVQFKTASGTGITFGVSEKTTRLVYSDGTNLVDAGFGGALDIEGRELVLDADGDTTITADTDDQIDIKIGGADDFQFTANTFTAQSGSSIVVPESGLTFGSTAITSTAAELNLLDGVSGLVQADFTKLAAVDSTAAELNIVDGGTSATSTTVADADRVVLNDNGTMVQVAVTDLAAYFDDEITAMPNLTSVGTLTTLTVDNVIINGSTIGHTGDTDLLTVASGIVTVAGEISVTTLDIGGTNVTSTAAELNLLDGKDATHLAVPGKIEGTNFTDSLLIGHSTTGTLSSAEDNTGVGIGALDALTSGAKNTAIGQDAGTVLTTGSNNTFIGNDAGLQATDMQGCVAIGSGALGAADPGNNNIAIGESAGRLITGARNLCIGENAGDNITSGSGNVIIGSAVDPSSATGNRQLIISGNDGSTTTTWISGDSNGIVTFADDILIKDDGTIGSASAATAMTIESSGQVNFVGDINVADDIFMSSDSAQFTFGANSEIRLQHVHNVGLQILHTATGDDSTVNLTLATDEADIAANDVIGQLNFQAPSEGTGTDSRLVAASIAAISEGDFAADNNATKLSFRTAVSETAAEKMSLSSDGTLTVSHDVILANDSFVQFGDAGEKISGDGTNLTIASSGNTTIESDNIIIDAASALNLDAGGASINLKSNGTKFAVFTNDSSHFAISADISDKDIRFKGSDGGSVITALTLDMSDAGTAIFNHDLVIADAGFIGSASDTDAIAIASNGVVTFSQTPVNSAGAAFVTDDPTALAIALG
jgi:hypothetical protein